ncbi:unnamed protein product [Schistosoma margrebowiei]|uniref:Uncharacterized protein n=1 Tax=Schistosoma margrebowiei TaxID=48269 RepID=A0A183LA36_9TREM|nr:unnamed protein product [Schistosoma margrebowiei]
MITRNTIDSSESIRRLNFADDLPFPSQTNTDEDNYCNISLCTSRPQYIQRKKQDPQTQHYINQVTFDGKTMEEVKSFTDMCSITDELGRPDTGTKTRITKSRTVFLHLNNIWNSKQLYMQVNIKVRIFNMKIKLVSSTVRN